MVTTCWPWAWSNRTSPSKWVGLGSPLAACSVYGDLTCSVHLVNNLCLFNCQCNFYLCNRGPYVRDEWLAFVPNMLSSWNKDIINKDIIIVYLRDLAIYLLGHGAGANVNCRIWQKKKKKKNDEKKKYSPHGWQQKKKKVLAAWHCIIFPHTVLQNILYCGKSYSFHRYCRQKILRLIVFAVLPARGVKNKTKQNKTTSFVLEKMFRFSGLVASVRIPSHLSKFIN